MNIEKLEFFVDLVKTQNYTETAERFFTTQSNVSKQILALEKDLSVQLFDRSHRSIQLTEEGMELLPYAQVIVSQFSQMKRHAALLQKNTDEVLSLLTIPTLIKYDGFKEIIHFVTLHPEFTLQLKEVEASKLHEEVKDSNTTLIYTRFFQWETPQTDVLITDEDQFVALLPRSSPLAKENRLPLYSLRNENFLLLSNATLLKQPVINLCEEAGFKPKIGYEGERIDLVLQMVREGLGVSILMEKTLNLSADDSVIAIPITPTKKSYLAFIKKKSNFSKGVCFFWEYLKNQDNYSLLE